MGARAHDGDDHHDHDHHHQPRTLRTRLVAALALSVCAAGIYASYITQGLVSEHLQLRRYGARGERFAHFEVLNGAQAAVCFVAAYAIVVLDWARAWLTSGGKSAAAAAPPTPAPARATRAAAAAAAAAAAEAPDRRPSPLPSPLEYWRPALSNAVGPAFGMVALRNISYSAQVLSKSCKMVPVMLAGAFLHSRSYSPLEYGAMMLVGGGVGLFAAGGAKGGGEGGKGHGAAAAAALEAPNAPLGYLLVALNLALDGYTNAAQDDVNRRHPRNSPVRMMAWMNLWGAAYYGAYCFLLTRTGHDTLSFCARHPEAARDLLLFCACGAVGQLFIFATIKRFGSVATSLVCTTRKFFSVLASAVYGGGAALTAAQWLGVAGVFAGLLGSMALKERQHGLMVAERAARRLKKDKEAEGGGGGVAVVATAAATPLRQRRRA